MVRSGYPQSFGAGIVCNAGTLGILIPPSIVMVVYAAATETSVGKLFMAGVIPGVLLRSEEHTSELQSLMRISYAVFCLKKKTRTIPTNTQLNDVYICNLINTTRITLN